MLRKYFHTIKFEKPKNLISFKKIPPSQILNDTMTKGFRNKVLIS